MSLADVISSIRKKADEKERAMLLPFNLVDYINQRLTSERIVDPPKDTDVYRVSGLAKFCPREEALRNKFNIPKKESIDSRLQRVFDIGTAFHSLVQNNWLKQWGILWGNWKCPSCRKEFTSCSIKSVCPSCGSNEIQYVELDLKNDEHGITGHCDGILVFNDKKYLLELKTCSSKQFELITRMRNKPLDAHVVQVQMYMYLTGVRSAIVLYFEKDESQVHQFEIHYDNSVVNTVLGYVAQARSGIKTGILPMRELCKEASCARAKACSVRKYCFN